MEGITNDQAHRLAEEALAKSKAEDHIKFQNTLYQINAGIKTYAEKGYKVFEETLSGSKFDYVEVDRLRDNLKKRGFKVNVEYNDGGVPHWNLTVSWNKPNNKKVQTKTWVNLMILLIALTLIFYFIKIMVWWMS
ncbi:MAG: hypothetical protein UEU88_05145 [Streptococcus salivarius]|nr:hypothetical protein [Streptococcus salivarius]